MNQCIGATACMVVTRRHNGTPRRIMDLSPLNKHCKLETSPTESPLHLARRVPKGTWKTVSDAWNGYHSPLRQSDRRHLTTFITPFGRWRYTREPQCFLSSGDGYNRRFVAILSDFERKERCVADTIHCDTDLQTHWWRTIDFLIRVGQAGIVLNTDTFYFARRIVDFTGFRISDETIEPLPKHMDAIRDFPTPTSTTDIRVARKNIPRECRRKYVPCLTSESIQLIEEYREKYEDDPFADSTITIGEELMSAISEERRKAWQTLIESTDMTHNSKKAWSTIR